MHASDLDRANTYNQLNLPVQSSWGPSAIIELLFGVILTFLTVLAIYLAHQYHHTRQRCIYSPDSFLAWLTLTRDSKS